MERIQQTFCFLDGIGTRRERALWKQGITDWNMFLREAVITGVSKERKAYYDRHLRRAQNALAQDDAAYFRNFGREQWRLYRHFSDDAGFLDIETDSRGKVSVAGISNYYDTRTFVRGVNLEKAALERELNRYKLIITFNGSAFDLPKLKKEFDTILEVPHIDLKGLCARLGLKGGLKEVEKTLNLQRPPHLNGNPVELWKAFHASGDRDWLDLLIAYNSEDIENLKWVMEHCYEEMEQQLVQ